MLLAIEVYQFKVCIFPNLFDGVEKRKFDAPVFKVMLSRARRLKSKAEGRPYPDKRESGITTSHFRLQGCSGVIRIFCRDSRQIVIEDVVISGPPLELIFSFYSKFFVIFL